MQARYYASGQGRFTSVDEFKGGPEEVGILGSGDPEKQALVYAEIGIPQSLNKYQYCFNNPLRYVDVDGQKPQDGRRGRDEERDVQALGDGRITVEQFKQRQQERVKAEGAGAIAGLAIVAAPYLIRAAVLWAALNPDKANNLAQEVVQMSSGNPMTVPGLGSLPKLTPPTSGNNGELFKQIKDHVLALKGDGAAKASLFEGLATVAKQMTGGGFEAVRVATKDGSYLYAGRGAEVLIITQAGKVYRGTQKAITFVKGVADKIDYDKLKEVK
jgi:RHS repeat-associated protein